MAKMTSLPRKKVLFSSTLLLITLLMAMIINTSSTKIGVCYGLLGDNLPPKQEVISLYKQHNIQRMRLYNPDPDVLRALSGSNIELMLGVPNEDLQRIATSQSEADAWVQNNIKNFPTVNFRYLAVGNEISPGDNRAQHIVPAMEKLQSTLTAAGLGIKVSSAVHTGTLADPSYPPSKGTFRPEYKFILDPLIAFLTKNKSPLLLNVYPYFSYSQNKNQISLDYALFKAPGPVVFDASLQYQNLFDSLVDAVYSALEKSGGRNVEIVVSETGWPTGGGEGTSMENAMTFNTNLIRRLNNGTPKKPGRGIEAYLFAMFDENLKGPPELEKYWGLFNPTNKQLKYEIKF